MAKGKKGAFDLGEFDISKGTQDEQETQNIQQVQYVQHEHEKQVVQDKKIVFGATQGRKGEKAPRINMAFSPDNHSYLKFESRRQGMSITEFANMIIGQYRENHPAKYPEE